MCKQKISKNNTWLHTESDHQPREPPAKFWIAEVEKLGETAPKHISKILGRKAYGELCRERAKTYGYTADKAEILFGNNTPKSLTERKNIHQIIADDGRRARNWFTNAIARELDTDDESRELYQTWYGVGTADLSLVENKYERGLFVNRTSPKQYLEGIHAEVEYELEQTGGEQ